MPTADDVVVEFEARTAGYEADLKRSRRVFEQSVGAQEDRIRSFERQMKRSSGQISSTLKGLAATFAGALSARELVRLSDSFTRLQNNLRVAGQEGEQLAQTQSALLDISQRYGVSLESLSSVFLKASLAQEELGASGGQIVQLNEVIAASLKITGTSAEQAQGALLQLGQALGSGVVRAEEFNSLLEGALPLVQAAARGIDRYGGSVSKLRADVAAGNVTSKEFFEGVLRGGVQTIKDAEKATLTLSGGFEALTSSLTVYIGEADKANGVSAAVGEALKGIADNLDTLIPALAAISVGLGTRYVASAVAARLATAGVTTAMGALTLASRGAGAALLVAMGNPVVLAIGAVAGGLAYLALTAENAEEKTRRLAASAEEAGRKADEMEARLREAGVGLEKVGNEAQNAEGKVAGFRGEMVRAIGVLSDFIKKAKIAELTQIGLAKREKLAERAQIERAQASRTSSIRNQTRTGDALASVDANVRAGEAPQLQKIDLELDNLERQERAILRGLAAGVDVSGAPTSSGASATGTPSGPRSSPSSADSSPVDRTNEIQRRFQDELDGYRSRIASAESSMAEDAEREAELALRQVNYAERQTLRSIEADKDLETEQKKRLSAVAIILAETERELVEFERRRRLEQEAQDLADERYRVNQDALRLEYELAKTEGERRDISMRILEAEDAFLKSKLDAVIASQTATDAEKERARIALESLNATAKDRKDVLADQQKGALGRYGDRAKDVDTRIEEAAAQRIRQLNDSIVDALSNELGIDDPFLRDLFSIFLDQAVFGPLAEALSNAGGGSGGLFSAIGTAVGSLFGGGRAIGGPVRAGVPYMVGENGPEMVVPQQNGVVVPNHSLSGGGPSVVNQTFVLDARGGITTPELLEYINKTARSEGQKARAGAAKDTLRLAPAAVDRRNRFGT